MAPDAEDCEEVERLKDEGSELVPTHQGRRILPDGAAPARAWTENEELDRSGGGSATNSPGENRRLLGHGKLIPPKQKSRLQAGLTLGVWGAPKKNAKYLQTAQSQKLKSKTKFQKRKEKIIAVLKPPYFILCIIVVMIGIHLWGSERLRMRLEWSPGAWWREPWRLLTYGFLHANTAHLALNALVALAVGWPLEREQGWRRVMAVWCGGVVSGALGAGVLQPQVHVVGASAAVYALLTAHLPNVCLRFGHIPLWWFRPLSVVVLGASEGCWALVRAQAASHSAHGQGDHVAWAAHALGAAVGVPLAFLVFSGENSSKRYILCSRIISGAMFLVGIVMVAVYYTCWYHDQRE